MQILPFKLSENGFFEEVTARKKYALFPTRLTCGKWIMFDTYYKVCELREPYNFADGPSFTEYKRFTPSDFEIYKEIKTRG